MSLGENTTVALVEESVVSPDQEGGVETAAAAEDNPVAPPANPEEVAKQVALAAWTDLVKNDVASLQSMFEEALIHTPTGFLDEAANNFKEAIGKLYDIDFTISGAEAAVEAAVLYTTAAGQKVRDVLHELEDELGEQALVSLPALADELEKYAAAIQAKAANVIAADLAAYQAILAKKNKERKKKKDDPTECKFWITWDSMYRRVKMGKWIGLTGSTDQTAKLWDMTMLECRGTLAGDDICHEGIIRCAALDTDSKRCITGASDGTLIMWNIETCAVDESHLSGKYGGMCTLVVDFQKRRALTGTASGTVCVWDTSVLSCSGSFQAHEGERICVTKADFCLGGMILTGCSADGRMRVWDVDTLQFLGAFEGDGNAGPARVAHVDLEGSKVLSGSRDGPLFMWDLRSFKPIATLRGHEDGVNALKMKPDLSMCVTAAEDNTAMLWDLGMRKCVGVFSGHIQGVRDVCADWRRDLIATCSDDTTVRIWNGNNFKCTGVLEGHMDRVTALRGRFDKDMLCSVSDDYTLRVWDLEYLKEEGVLYGHSGAIKCLAAREVQSISD